MAAALADDPVAVLTAIADPALDTELAASFARTDLGVTVVRRCVDVMELLSAATTGTARAALLSADLRGLDRQAVATLHQAGLATVGLAGSESAQRQLHQLGCTLVIAASAGPEQTAGAVRAAARLAEGGVDRAPTLQAALPSRDGTPSEGATTPAAEGDHGRVVAVWGPAGSPGRTTAALGLADALAGLGVPALIADADPYGGAVAVMAGLLDEAPGIAAACRAANAGMLDVPLLSRCCVQLTGSLRALTGIAEPWRWPELRPSSIEMVLTLARSLVEVTVVDCGFCLEDEEDAALDALGAPRNAATLTALRQADVVVAVGSADPLGLTRLLRDLPALSAVLGGSVAELVSSRRLRIVLNRSRSGLLPGDPVKAATSTVERLAGATVTAVLPLDVAAADAAHGSGRLLSEAAAQSRLRVALAELAAAIAERPLVSASGRWFPAAGRRRRSRHRGPVAPPRSRSG